MTEPSLAEAVEARFPDALIDQHTDQGCPTLTLTPQYLVQVCEFLRDEPGFRYDLLVALTVAQGSALYQLASTDRASRLLVRVPLEESAVDSLAFVWPAANWAEREAHDLWDIVFEGHPDLSPLLDKAEPPMTWLKGKDRETYLGGTRYPTSVDALTVRFQREGGRVIRAEPVIGDRHSGVAKRLTEWPYPNGTLLAARLDGFSAMSCDLAYALALEQLLCIEAPPRAQWLRTIYGELGRIASHLFWCAQCAATLSDPPFCAPAYAWEGRAAILELFQRLGGNPLMPDVIAIGGLHRDTPPDFDDALGPLVGELETLLDDLERLISDRAGFRAEMTQIGIIDPGTALGLGMTGPCLRACGIGYDVRRAFPYAAYGSLEIMVPVQQGCDADARYAVRMAETRSSIEIIRQAQRHLEPGPVNALPAGGAFPPLPTGTAYASVEGPRGELGVLAVAAGEPTLAHAYVRAPSFANLSALPFFSYGRSAERFAVVLDSLDISMAEVER